MFKKIQILKRFINKLNRVFQANILAKQTTNLIQYHSGGEDFNPPENIEAIGGYINDNPANGIVFAYKDSIERLSLQGEKRIYATSEDGKTITAEIHLKNNGDIIIYPKNEGKIISYGNLIHNGDIVVYGTITADNVIAQNGATGTYSNSVISENGIVTGGS